VNIDPQGLTAAAAVPAGPRLVSLPAADLADAVWQKSSRSGPFTDNCVEVAFIGDTIAVRDSKNAQGPALLFNPAEWDAFVEGAKDGEFDL
jgi:hypothetical protein